MSGGDLEAMLKGMNNGEAATAPVPGNTVATPSPALVPTEVLAPAGNGQVEGGLAAMEAAMNAGVTLTTPPPAESTPSEIADAAVPPEPAQVAAVPASQPGALAAMMGESKEAPAPTQTVAQAAQSTLGETVCS